MKRVAFYVMFFSSALLFLDVYKCKKNPFSYGHYLYPEDTNQHYKGLFPLSSSLSKNSLGDLTAARMALVLPSLTHLTVLE